MPTAFFTGVDTLQIELEDIATDPKQQAVASDTYVGAPENITLFNRFYERLRDESLQDLFLLLRHLEKDPDPTVVTVARQVTYAKLVEGIAEEIQTVLSQHQGLEEVDIGSLREFYTSVLNYRQVAPCVRAFESINPSFACSAEEMMVEVYIDLFKKLSNPQFLSLELGQVCELVSQLRGVFSEKFCRERVNSLLSELNLRTNETSPSQDINFPSLGSKGSVALEGGIKGVSELVSRTHSLIEELLRASPGLLGERCDIYSALGHDPCYVPDYQSYLKEYANIKAVSETFEKLLDLLEGLKIDFLKGSILEGENDRSDVSKLLAIFSLARNGEFVGDDVNAATINQVLAAFKELRKSIVFNKEILNYNPKEINSSFNFTNISNRISVVAQLLKNTSDQLYRFLDGLEVSSESREFLTGVVEKLSEEVLSGLEGFVASIRLTNEQIQIANHSCPLGRGVREEFSLGYNALVLMQALDAIYLMKRHEEKGETLDSERLASLIQVVRTCRSALMDRYSSEDSSESISALEIVKAALSDKLLAFYNREPLTYGDSKPTNDNTSAAIPAVHLSTISLGTIKTLLDMGCQSRVNVTYLTAEETRQGRVYSSKPPIQLNPKDIIISLAGPEGQTLVSLTAILQDPQRYPTFRDSDLTRAIVPMVREQMLANCVSSQDMHWSLKWLVMKALQIPLVVQGLSNVVGALREHIAPPFILASVIDLQVPMFNQSSPNAQEIHLPTVQGKKWPVQFITLRQKSAISTRMESLKQAWHRVLGLSGDSDYSLLKGSSDMLGITFVVDASITRLDLGVGGLREQQVFLQDKVAEFLNSGAGKQVISSRDIEIVLKKAKKEGDCLTYLARIPREGIPDLIIEIKIVTAALFIKMTAVPGTNPYQGRYVPGSDVDGEKAHSDYKDTAWTETLGAIKSLPFMWLVANWLSSSDGEYITNPIAEIVEMLNPLFKGNKDQWSIGSDGKLTQGLEEILNEMERNIVERTALS